MRVIASFLTLLVACLAYLFYVPPTPGYGWQMRIEGIKMTFAEKYTMIADSLGFDSAQVYRDILKFIFSMPLSQDPDVDFESLALKGIQARLYKPKKSAHRTDLPAVIVYHGGGWTIGSIDDIHPECLRLSKKLQAVVLSIEYRLSPENTFPVPFEDCLAVTKYFMSNAKKYGVNPNRIALKGLSAGGALVAGVSLALRDANFRPQPKLQVIEHAVLQVLTLDTPSYQFHADNHYLTKNIMAWFFGNYLLGNQKHFNTLLNSEHIPKSVVQPFLNELLDALPDDGIKASYIPHARSEVRGEFWKTYGHLCTNEYAFPLMAQNLTGLPKAHVYTCYHDVLRDDGMLYEKRLREAGNDVIGVHLYKCHHLWTMYHGFNQHSITQHGDIIKRISEDL